MGRKNPLSAPDQAGYDEALTEAGRILPRLQVTDWTDAMALKAFRGTVGKVSALLSRRMIVLQDRESVGADEKAKQQAEYDSKLALVMSMLSIRDKVGLSAAQNEILEATAAEVNYNLPEPSGII